MNKNYIILDFGKVVAGPGKDGWFIPPRFHEYVKLNIKELDQLKEEINKNDSFLQMPMLNESDEFLCFSMLYRTVLTKIGYQVDDYIIESLADDWTYNDDKFHFYPNIREELEYLTKKYKLLMLTDNWPSVFRIMHNKDLYKYFQRIYVSSMYLCDKSGKKFFEYPIKDYILDGKNTIFIDDSVDNLNVALSVGLTPILMDRENENIKVKYKKINNLFEIK